MGKKLLILFGILILSILSFGAETAEEKVEIKAKVVGGLRIEVKNAVNFGIIFPGETKPQEEKGIVSLCGPGGHLVIFKVKDKSGNFVNYQGPKQKFNVELKNESSDNDTMNANISLYSEACRYGVLDGVVALGIDGQVDFEAKGELTADGNQASGNYKGYLYVKIINNYKI